MYKGGVNKLNDEVKVKEKEKDVFFSVAVTQSVLAVILIVCILIIKFFFKGQYKDIKKWYSDNMTVDTNISEIVKEATK